MADARHSAPQPRPRAAQPHLRAQAGDRLWRRAVMPGHIPGSVEQQRTGGVSAEAELHSHTSARKLATGYGGALSGWRGSVCGRYVAFNECGL